MINYVTKGIMKAMMKIETSTKTELEKVAGEVQAIQGGNVTLSDAVSFLITFYREHKEQKQ